MRSRLLPAFTCALLLASVGSVARAQDRRGVGTPAAPTVPAFYPIPIQSYATVDIGHVDGARVSIVALDDQNNAAFASVVPASAGSSKIVVYSWQNGQTSASPLQTVPMSQVFATGPDGTTPIDALIIPGFPDL